MIITIANHIIKNNYRRIKTGFNSFTPEQISELRSNKYTYKVTRKTIQFTIEFKERYIFERKQGVMPKKILYDAGYDPEALGDNRISGISCMMNALIRSGKQPTEGQPKNKRMPPSNTDYLSMGQSEPTPESRKNHDFCEV